MSVVILKERETNQISDGLDRPSR